jgi:hypothetical protein
VTRVSEPTETAQPVYPKPPVPTDLYGLVDYIRTRTADELDEDFGKLVLALGAAEADGLFREAASIVAADRRVATRRSVVGERLAGALSAAMEAEEALQQLLFGDEADPDFAEGDPGSDLAYQLRVGLRSLRMADTLYRTLAPNGVAKLTVPTERTAEYCAFPLDWEGEHDHSECLSALADRAAEQAQQPHPDRVGLCGADTSEPHAWVQDVQVPNEAGYYEWEACGQLATHPIHDLPQEHPAATQTPSGGAQ